MTLAVVTPVHGRAAHLRLQEESLRRSSLAPEVRVVVAMADPDVAARAAPGTVVVAVDRMGAALPLARARNLGAQAALDAGADLIVFLDVDCLVGPGTLARYREAAGDPRTSADLLTGPTGYLPEPGPDAAYDLDALPEARFHAGRPRPADGAHEREVTPTAFWSLSSPSPPPPGERSAVLTRRTRGTGARTRTMPCVRDGPASDSPSSVGH